MSETAMEKAEEVWSACFPVPWETAEKLQQNTEKMHKYLLQMAQMMLNLQNRLDELEEKQKAATICHDEVLVIRQLIRMRADEYCGKYGLKDPKDLAKIRAAIKKSVLQRYGIKDLHDVPAFARQAVEDHVSRWTDIRMVMRMLDGA